MTGIGAPSRYRLTPNEAVLVGVDFQQAFGDKSWEHVPHAQAAVDRFREVARAWRKAGGRVIFVHTTYYSDDPVMDAKAEKIPESRSALMEGTFGATFYPNLVESDDIQIRKLGFSAVTGSNLLEVLAELNRETVLLGGLTTPYCVQATADGINLAGLRVGVIGDTCASQPIGDFSAEQAHNFAIQRISYLVGQVVSSEDLLANLLGLNDG